MPKYRLETNTVAINKDNKFFTGTPIPFSEADCYSRELPPLLNVFHPKQKRIIKYNSIQLNKNNFPGISENGAFK